jgi:hypothetical protein
VHRLRRAPAAHDGWFCFSRIVSAEKWGALTLGLFEPRRNAARQQWTTHRIELRLTSRAKPTTVAITDDSGSIVSGEKYPKSIDIESIGHHP